MHSVAEELRLRVSSGYPLIYLLTHEEERGRRLVLQALTSLGLRVEEWSVSGGRDAANDRRDPVAMLRSLRGSGPGATLLLDFHPYLQEAEVLRTIRDLTTEIPPNRHTLIIMSPRLVIPAEIEKDISILELPLPTRTELVELIMAICAEENRLVPEDLIDGLVRAAQGLTENEARRVFTKALRKQGDIDRGHISLIIEEKKHSIRKSEVLEYFELEEDLGQVGGLEEVKRWVDSRNSAFSEEAVSYGLPAPKGLLLIGVQGCGKSLMAKAVAGAWHLPLIRLDLSAVFGSASAETAIHRAMSVTESLAPVVLWVDEIEKGFADVEGGTAGNATRVFGSFVTWLQEKRLPVFVVATANEVAGMPPELLRKGRFDETFFIDLPDVHERKAILAIHLSKRGRNPRDFDLDRLSRQTEHYSGSELEQAVVSGMYRAFAEHREVNSDDIGKELENIVPLYATFEEKIKALRDWAKTRARPASQDRTLVDLFD